MFSLPWFWLHLMSYSVQCWLAWKSRKVFYPLHLCKGSEVWHVENKTRTKQGRALPEQWCSLLSTPGQAVCLHSAVSFLPKGWGFWHPHSTAQQPSCSPQEGLWHCWSCWWTPWCQRCRWAAWCWERQVLQHISLSDASSDICVGGP